MFDWLGESPGAGLQWADFLVSFVALGLAAAALPSALQMFWGRSRVNVRFDRSVEDDQRILLVYLDNPPVTSRLLKRLGVRRDAVQSLEVSFRISEAGSGTIIDPIRHARIFTNDNPADANAGNERVILPPTYSVAASFPVASWDTQHDRAIIPADRLREELVLKTGYYRIDIAVVVDGQPKHMQRRLVVGQGADDLRWSA